MSEEAKQIVEYIRARAVSGESVLNRAGEVEAAAMWRRRNDELAAEIEQGFHLS